jgi:RNA polymerase sigma-70 factor (ECF subfamily)
MEGLRVIERRHAGTATSRPAENDADLALLRRSNAGDRNAFHELYSKYYHPLLRFIYRITGQLELAKEGINDVMLAVWNGGKSFAGRSSVSTWIMGIAYHKALKLSERSKRWSDRFASTDFEQWSEPSGTPEEHIYHMDIQDLLGRGLEQLSAEHRAVVELTYFYGYSYEQIAAIVECPVNTVKTRMFYARARLRELVPAVGEDEPPS